MQKARFAARMVVVAAAIQWTNVAYGQNYPERPIRIITAEVGGAGDLVARIVASNMSAPLGQPVVVENRAAALNGEIAARATPDGYTLLLASSSFISAPLFAKTPYDPVKDFAPITMLAKAPHTLVVHPSLAVNSVKELVALAKAKPGVLNYGTGGTGSSLHVAGELFKQLAGVDIVRVAYKGAGPATTALIGGEVQVVFAPAATAAPLIRSGKLRALAVTSPQPSALAPGLPTMTNSGVPGYEMEAIYALVAPLKTPAAVINLLNKDIVSVLNQADSKDKFLKAGVEAAPGTAKELAAAIKSEIDKMTKLVKETGIKAE